MSMTLIDVLDSLVKIGLGSAITAFAGYSVLKRTQDHDDKKSLKSHYYKLQEERKIKYVEFLSQSQTLVQKYLSSCCSCQGEDYCNYLNVYNQVQIISSDEIRIAGFKLLSAVNEFIVVDHSNIEVGLSKVMRKSVNDNVGMFQKLAQNDVTRKYSEE